jgi:hypothetical protein
MEPHDMVETSNAIAILNNYRTKKGDVSYKQAKAALAVITRAVNEEARELRAASVAVRRNRAMTRFDRARKRVGR